MSRVLVKLANKSASVSMACLRHADDDSPPGYALMPRATWEAIRDGHEPPVAIPSRPAGNGRRARKWPAWAQMLARLARPGDKGLGDVLERQAARMGGRKMKLLLKKIGIQCGCTNRQNWLNRQYPLPAGGAEV